MAQCASLILSRLVVSRASRSLEGERVALQAQQIHLTDAQQPRIGRTVRRMAAGATLGLHRYMFVNERTLFVGVTFEADSVSLRHSLNLAQRGRAMHVVAITTLNQSLINAMVKWFRKVSFGSDVAAKAKGRLRVNQQVLGFCRVVERVAI